MTANVKKITTDEFIEIMNANVEKGAKITLTLDAGGADIISNFDLSQYSHSLFDNFMEFKNNDDTIATIELDKVKEVVINSDPQDTIYSLKADNWTVLIAFI